MYAKINQLPYQVVIKNKGQMNVTYCTRLDKWNGLRRVFLRFQLW